MTNLKYCFVSNYLTHHQLPFCLEMVNSTKGSFYFIEDAFNQGLLTREDIANISAEHDAYYDSGFGQ